MNTRVVLIVLKTFLILIPMWAMHFFAEMEWIGRLKYGVFPRSIDGTLGIITSPLMHADWNHLWSNTAALLPVLVLLFAFYPTISNRVTVAVWLLSGLLLWFFGRPLVHIGASGFVYGISSFLVISGLIKKNKLLARVSLVTVVLNTGYLWGMLPMENGVSYESHFLGFITGLLMAVYFMSEGPQPDPKRKIVDYEPNYDWGEGRPVEQYFEPKQEIPEEIPIQQPHIVVYSFKPKE